MSVSTVVPPLPADSDLLERCLIATWCIITLILGLFGSLLTLWASMKHNVIRPLNKISSALINNIAIADFGFALLVNLPVTMAVISEKWIFGEFHCMITAVFEEIFAFADFNMICGLAMSKLGLLLYPMQARTWTHKRATQIVAFLWTIAIAVGLQNLIFMVVGLQKMKPFDKRSGLFMCTLEPDHQHGNIFWLEVVEFTALTIYPTVIVIASSGMLLALARQHMGIRTEAILPALLISLVYCICVLPIGILFIFDLSHIKELVQAAYFAPFLNSAVNFPIYLLTLRTFRQFFLGRFRLGINRPGPPARGRRGRQPVPSRERTHSSHRRSLETAV